jgi:hypothetical protein
MRRISVVAFLIFIPPLAVSAEPNAEALAIVDKAIKAHGSDKAAKSKGHTWKAKGTMFMGDMKMEYKIDYIFASPDKFRFDLDMDAGGMKIRITAATDGKVAWEQALGQMREMTKEKQTEFEHTAYLMHLCEIHPLKDKAFTLIPIEGGKDDGQEFVGIQVQRKDRRTVNLYFDKTTGLLGAATTKVIDEFSKKEVVQETRMSGYRNKDGVKVFDNLTIKRDGKDFLVEEMSDQKELETVDEKLFAKPTEKK